MRSPYRFLLLAACFSSSLTSSAQTLWTPAGAVGSNNTNSNVGIGVAQPSELLSLFSPQGTNVELYSYAHFGTDYSAWSTIVGSNVRAKHGQVDGMELATNYLGSGASVIRLNFGSMEFHTASAASISNYTEGSPFSFPRLVINGTGNVGIGTSSLSSRLVVASPETSASNTVIAEFTKDGGTNSYGSSVLRLSRSIGGNSTDLELNSGGDGPFRYGTFLDTLVVNNQAATNGGYGSIHLITSQAVRFTVGGGTLAGNVGIATAHPNARLDIGGPTGAQYGTVAVKQAGAGQKGIWLQSYESNNALAMYHMNSYAVISTDYTGSGTHVPLALQTTGGGVGIGTTNPGAHKLAVNGSMKAKEVVVETTGWSDYVFADGYELATLDEVEAHIREHKHLPGIPSAGEVAEHGVSVGEMQAKLLAKIEELTLHLIAQQKDIEMLKAQNAELLESGRAR